MHEAKQLASPRAAKYPLRPSLRAWRYRNEEHFAEVCQAILEEKKGTELLASDVSSCEPLTRVHLKKSWTTFAGQIPESHCRHPNRDCSHSFSEAKVTMARARPCGDDEFNIGPCPILKAVHTLE